MYGHFNDVILNWHQVYSIDGATHTYTIVLLPMCQCFSIHVKKSCIIRKIVQTACMAIYACVLWPGSTKICTIRLSFFSYSGGGLQWFAALGLWWFAYISLVSLPIVPNSGGDLWSFAMICFHLWSFAVVCGGLSFSHTHPGSTLKQIATVAVGKLANQVRRFKTWPILASPLCLSSCAMEEAQLKSYISSTDLLSSTL